jgi:hypothetical protein
MVMFGPDDDLDERLRRAAAAEDGAVERIVRGALAAPERRGLSVPVASLGAVLALVVAAFGAWSWTHRPQPTAAVAASIVLESSGDVVLVRAPDGSSLIVSTTPREDEMPAGSGYVISEGGGR